MKCPNCGSQIDDDKLYCEVCGCEFQIVPDMDVDFEVGMDDTLSDIAMEEFGHETVHKKRKAKDRFEDMDYDDDPSLFGYLLKNPKTGWIFYVLVFLILICLIVAAFNLNKNLSKEKSKDYQIEMANEAIEKNDLEEAIKYLESAYRADKTDYEILFTIADYYYTLNRNDDAIFTLKDIALNADFSYDVREKAYRKIISLYKSENRYEDIKDTLQECTLGSICEEFSSYNAPVPIFSLEGGTYNETVALKLSDDVEGTIYYTTDGTIPNESSAVYESPIFLEYGSYTIQAFFVNTYGIKSEVIKNTYLIDVAFTFKPDVLTDSGSYTSATMIEVDVPVMYTVYYTSDGSTPDKSATKYTSPIPMPIGDSEYKFISYASDGTESEIVVRNFNLTYSAGALTPAEAVDFLVEGLVERGHISDTSGNKEGFNGKYLYIFVAPYAIENVGDVYFVVEYYEDSLGNRSKSNNIYGINVFSGELYSVQSMGQGTYSVNKI